jgi:hypothetical protein
MNSYYILNFIKFILNLLYNKPAKIKKIHIKDRNYFFDEIIAGNKEYKKLYDNMFNSDQNDEKIINNFRFLSNEPLIDLGDCGL